MLVIDVVLYIFATFDDYIDSLQSIIHISVDLWMFVSFGWIITYEFCESLIG
jgi:hypothetical protein